MPEFDLNKPMTRRAFFSRLTQLSLGVVLAGSGGVGYSRFWEPTWLSFEKTRLFFPDLPAGFNGLTIAHISDLHLGPYMDPAFIRKVVDLVLESRPEMIVITGDFVSRVSHGENRTIETELSRLKADLGVFAILGNHDWWTNAPLVSRSIENAGITLLRNRNVPVVKNGQRLFVVGVDDVWEQKNDLPRALSGIPADARIIALVHEPDFADQVAEDDRVILQLSGHSHGGQVRFPLLGAPVLPYLGQKYPWGSHRIKRLQLYTNRGIGVLYPLRFNCRPEITLHTLFCGQEETRKV